MPAGVTEVTPDFQGDDKFTTPEGIELDAYVATFQLGMIRARAIKESSSSEAAESSAPASSSRLSSRASSQP